MVSHDRYFLNEVVTDVCHFHKGKLTTYRGDINNFTAVLEENKNRQIRLYEQQEAKREHLQKCKSHYFSNSHHSCSYFQLIFVFTHTSILQTLIYMHKLARTVLRLLSNANQG